MSDGKEALTVLILCCLSSIVAQRYTHTRCQFLSMCVFSVINSILRLGSSKSNKEILLSRFGRFYFSISF